ncbi:hypothetical protein OROGR_022463 [Orobanche gracilis]
MGSTFNPHILVEKLSKLNSSQQSIETLSHWCIFHMNKAKQVVETWDRQFHCAPREQRLAFLYLANDILQNSRRKGAEFAAEFWNVLMDSLRDVIENGDESEKKAALRLIHIWEERKVFGSRSQLLKEEFAKGQLGNDIRNLKHAGSKSQSPGGNALERLVSGYQAVYGSQHNEDAIFNKCRNAISFIEKVDKDIEGEYGLGHANSSITDELKGQHAILRDCIEQLSVVESSRANIVSLLTEALQDQVNKLEQVRVQLQAAQMRSEEASTICRQLLSTNGDGQVLAEQNGNPNPANLMSPNSTSGPEEQSFSVMYTQQAPLSVEKSDDPKFTAAALAAKLAASTSSAEMLTLVLSSLASKGVIGNNNLIKDSSDIYPSEKRAKIENEHPSFVPQAPQALVNSRELAPDEKPHPPSSPPPLMPPLPPMQPYPVPQYIQTVMSTRYGYNVGQQMPIGQPGYGLVAPPNVSGFAPSNSYQSYPPESGFYGQPSSLSMAPMSHQ